LADNFYVCVWYQPQLSNTGKVPSIFGPSRECALPLGCIHKYRWPLLKALFLLLFLLLFYQKGLPHLTHTNIMIPFRGPPLPTALCYVWANKGGIRVSDSPLGHKCFAHPSYLVTNSIRSIRKVFFLSKYLFSCPPKGGIASK
jgi:hypothetical protein